MRKLCGLFLAAMLVAVSSFANAQNPPPAKQGWVNGQAKTVADAGTPADSCSVVVTGDFWAGNPGNNQPDNKALKVQVTWLVKSVQKVPGKPDRIVWDPVGDTTREDTFIAGSSSGSYTTALATPVRLAKLNPDGTNAEYKCEITLYVVGKATPEAYSSALYTPATAPPPPP